MEPIAPTPNDVKLPPQPRASTRSTPADKQAQERAPGPTRISELDEDEKEEYSFLKNKWRHGYKLYDEQRRTLREFNEDIFNTIDSTLHEIIAEEVTPHAVFRRLKTHFEWTGFAREQWLLAKWDTLKNPIADQPSDVEAWFIKWETIFQKGKSLNIPDFTIERRLVQTFVTVVSNQISPDWAVQQQMEIARETNLQFLLLIKHFRNY
jgi:hypothetical protein